MMNTKQMKSTFNIVLILGILILLTSCFDKEKPNYQYMDNMYEPVGYEAYGAYNVFENEQEAKLPAEGTVPRGWAPYDYEDYQKLKETIIANNLIAKDGLLIIEHDKETIFTDENVSLRKSGTVHFSIFSF